MWDFIAGLLVATGGAVVSGFAVQFFTYYRERRDEIDELTDTLHWITLLETEDIKEARDSMEYIARLSSRGGNVSLKGQGGYQVWRLRDRLYDAYEATHSQLDDDARESIQEIFDWYIAISRGNDSWGAKVDDTTSDEDRYLKWEKVPAKLSTAANETIEEIDTLSVRECFYDFAPFPSRKR